MIYHKSQENALGNHILEPSTAFIVAIVVAVHAGGAAAWYVRGEGMLHGPHGQRAHVPEGPEVAAGFPGFGSREPIAERGPSCIMHSLGGGEGHVKEHLRRGGRLQMIGRGRQISLLMLLGQRRGQYGG